MSTRPPSILTLGDALVDVVAETGGAPVPDDDVPARITLVPGGQGANVAAWAAYLGAQASIITTTLGRDPAGRLVRELLEARRITVRAATTPAATGTVVSLVSADGRRTMLSDRGGASGQRPGRLEAEWFAGVTWFHISGYALLSPEDPDTVIEAATRASHAGAGVSVDLSAATVVAARGGARSAALIKATGAELVFGTVDEFEALGEVVGETRVIKLGPEGYRVEGGPGGSAAHHEAPDGSLVVRDTTGAGDAFAAGWLVGGPGLAVGAAEECIARVGAAPPAPLG